MSNGSPSLENCPHCGQFHPDDVLLCPVSERLLPLGGRILDGKFRFIHLLGEGGMGAVWKAENILVKKTVAIKLMHVQFSRDEGVLGRFRNEATAAGRIGSTHICDILDLGKSMLGPYIVMEMLKGVDLSQYVQQNGPLPPGTAVMVIRQALIGLQAAHTAGIVHRDLKPENIFLHQPDPGRLLVKLMDFGISKFTEGNNAGKTGMGVLMGTPEYMSPEQTEGAAQADARTDVWAMGVILYWALSGQNPFLAPTMAATLMNVTMREPPPLQQAAPHVDPGLVAIVERCLRKAPGERWPSAEALSDVLAPHEDPNATILGASPGAAPGASPTPPAFQLSPSGGFAALKQPQGSADTWSSQLEGAPLGSAPTLAAAHGDWNVGSIPDHRPESNIGGGKAGIMAIVFAVLVAAIGGGVYAAMNDDDEPDEPDVAVVDDAQAPASQTPASPTPTADGGAVPAADGGAEPAAEDDGKAEAPEPAADAGEPSETSTPATKPTPKPSSTKPTPAKPRPRPNPSSSKVRSVGSLLVARDTATPSLGNDAIKHCESLARSRYADRDDWRLPSAREARSVAPSGAPLVWLANKEVYDTKTRKSGARSFGEKRTTVAVCVTRKS